MSRLSHSNHAFPYSSQYNSDTSCRIFEVLLRPIKSVFLELTSLLSEGISQSRLHLTMRRICDNISNKV